MLFPIVANRWIIFSRGTDLLSTEICTTWRDEHFCPCRRRLIQSSIWITQWQTSVCSVEVKRKICQNKSEISELLTFTWSLAKHSAAPILSNVRPHANKDGQLVWLVSQSLGRCRIILKRRLVLLELEITLDRTSFSLPSRYLMYSSLKKKYHRGNFYSEGFQD